MTTSREDRGPQRINRTLDRLLGTMRAPSIDVLDAVFGRWIEIVGPDLDQHTRPAAIDGDELVIVADSPAWASECRWLQNELLARVESVSGSDRIKGVTVRVQRRE